MIFLGEVHDNPAHHAYQADLVSQIDPAAIVFEMLTPEQAEAILDVDRTDEAALREALDWDNSGWPDFSMYYPIFAASDAAIYGAAVPRDDLRRAMTDGAAEVFGLSNAEQFGLTPLTNDEIAALEDEMQAAHCNMLPPEMMAGMVEAQRLRDAVFARTAASAYGEIDAPVVVITGNEHARTDRGAAYRLALAHPTIAVWSIGQLEEGSEATDASFDEIRVTAAAEREDPCLAFQ